MCKLSISTLIINPKTFKDYCRDDDDDDDDSSYYCSCSDFWPFGVGPENLGPGNHHFADISSTYLDQRSLSLGPLRRRTHLKKYNRTNLGSRVAPKQISYATLLNTPTYELIPEIKVWEDMGDYLGGRFDYILPREGRNASRNTPPATAGEQLNTKPPTKAEKRRIYSLAKIAKEMTFSNRCSCHECRKRRVDFNNWKKRGTNCKILFEEGTDEVIGGVLSPLERDHLWVYDQYEEIPPITLTTQTQNNWAKLVDDAVHVWEGKRKREVEGLGWEVFSSSDDQDLDIDIETDHDLDVDHDDNSDDGDDREWDIVSV